MVSELCKIVVSIEDNYFEERAMLDITKDRPLKFIIRSVARIIRSDRVLHLYGLSADSLNV